MDKTLIKTSVSKILRRSGAKRAALFGSAVHGQQRPESDVDLLVELDDSLSLLDFIDLKRQLEATLGRRVDLVEYDSLKPALRDGILASQEIIFTQ